ncbi:tctex1 domain-containing protein 1-like [Harpegnathos saltator]|uniref:tctex1 domain-containing protein 1-like n=1 Tax=Harpegnathos saltator TaxID=610380 RepID=UPI000DBED101|nr:tctex1 domain-containing protein 1-like [Harpegnathos saltator]
MPLQLEVNDKICDDNEVPKYQNTYHMESQNPFKTDQVDKIVRSVMNNRLDELTYDNAESMKLCGDIASEIRRRMKKLNFNRYKIVIVVTIIEKVSQSVETTVGYLWDSEKDNYSVFSFEGRTFHAYCCVFGLYYE